MTAAEDKNPWLRLARFSEDHEENIQLWNGYQKYLLRPDIDEYQRQMKNPKFACIVDLSDAEIHNIQTEIPYLPKEIHDLRKRPAAKPVIALTDGIAEIQRFLKLSEFYFAFRVFIQNTTFKSVLTLNHAQFAAGLDVDECVFEGNLFASATNFGPFTMFIECSFIERTSFRNAKFKNAVFHRANFKKDCAFGNAEFVRKAIFTDSIFTDSVIFSHAKFHEFTDFNLNAASSAAVPLSFKYAKFCKHPPRFFGRALHEDTDWTGVKLPNDRSKTAQCECLRENDKCAVDTDQMAWVPLNPKSLLENDKRAYEQLRIKCGALGKVEDEHMFFRKEMELTGRLSPWYTRVTYWLYHLVSDYGHSYWRPIAGMGGLWALWSVFYALHFMARDQLHLCMDRVELLRSTMGLSFANVFAVFGFYRRFPSDLLADPTVVTVLLTVSETLLGFVFLFFLGLGLRTRFRLR